MKQVIVKDWEHTHFPQKNSLCFMLHQLENQNVIKNVISKYSHFEIIFLIRIIISELTI